MIYPGKSELSQLFPSHSNDDIFQIIQCIRDKNYEQASQSISTFKAVSEDALLFHLLSHYLSAEKHEIKEAENHAEHCLVYGPDHPLFINVYVSYLSSLELCNNALDGLASAQDKKPKSLNLRVAKCKMYLVTKKYYEAYKAVTSLPPKIQHTPEIVSIINEAISGLPTEKIDEEVYEQLFQLMQQDELSNKCFKKVVERLVVSSALYFEEQQTDVAIIDNQELFNAALRYLLIPNILLEKFLTILRRDILLFVTSNPDNNITIFNIIFSIAFQQNHNEYIYYFDNNEETIVNDLSILLNERLSAEKPELDQIILPLLLILMYRSPIEIECGNKLIQYNFDRYVPKLNEFINERIESHNLESDIAERFSKESELKDKTTIRVASQYEDNPYPRWTKKKEIKNISGLPYIESVGCSSSPQWRSYPNSSFTNVLVAGCGTGQQPISLAVNYPEFDITAVDISCRSLAYASIMTDKHHLKNIRYKRQDLLDINDLGTFDVIECSGVLHHMKDPKSGLDSLMKHLRPGGVIKLALYSAEYRKSIAHFRSWLEEQSATINDNFMRQIRRFIMLDGENSPFFSFTNATDFYSMSECRDLIFHEQECQYTFPELKTFIDNYDLNFLGFVVNKRVMNILKGSEFESISSYDFNIWGEAEQQFPNLFYNMYQFYCQYQPKQH